jgi:hypothetical protein
VSIAFWSKFCPVDFNLDLAACVTFCPSIIQYCPLILRRFQTVEIDIRDDTGVKIPFERGRVVVTLHCRNDFNNGLMITCDKSLTHNVALWSTSLIPKLNPFFIPFWYFI